MHKQHSSAARVDIYQEITDYIIGHLEKGVVPWHQSWQTIYGMPRNYTGAKLYRGFNALFLNMVTYLEGYKFPYFLTYKQARAMGGCVRKGEKSIRIVFYTARQNTKDLVPVFDHSTGMTRMEHPYYKMLKYHNVFNIEQVDGIDMPDEIPIPLSANEKIAACENIVTSMPHAPQIKYGNANAFYDVPTDRVIMPDLHLFESSEEFYSTLFHELGHATGHASRLCRDGIVKDCSYGTPLYAKEELIAELTSAYLSGIAGTSVQVRDNSTAYIANHLTYLRNDKKYFLFATTQAAAAVDYILNIKHDPDAASDAEPEAAPQAATC